MVNVTIQFYTGGTKTYNVPDGGSISVDSDWKSGIGDISFSGSGSVSFIGNGHVVDLSQKVTIASGVNVILDGIEVNATNPISGGNITLKNSTLSVNGTTNNGGVYPTSFTFDNSAGYSTLNVLDAPGTSTAIYDSNVNIYNLTPGDRLVIGSTGTKDVVWKKENDGSYTLYKGDTDASFPVYKKIMGGIHLAPGITPDMFEYDSSNGTIVCYLAGTNILTRNGNVKIENLKVGDMVKTESGFHSVTWIGSANVSVNQESPHMDFSGFPVVVKKGAIGENIPNEDLYLTPEHSIFIDGNLIPVRMLVNGISIKYIEMKNYTYYHFECAKHEIVVANGLKSESYLNTGNGAMFGKTDSQLKTWNDSAAPLNTFAVKPIFDKLAERAESLWKTKRVSVENKEIYLEVGNAKVHPFRFHDGKFLFMLPPRMENFNIVFNRVRHSDIIGPWHDDRRAIDALDFNIDDGRKVDIKNSTVRKDKVSLACKIAAGAGALSIRF